MSLGDFLFHFLNNADKVSNKFNGATLDNPFEPKHGRLDLAGIIRPQHNDSRRTEKVKEYYHNDLLKQDSLCYFSIHLLYEFVCLGERT